VLDNGLLKAGNDIAAAAHGRQFELQLPRPPRLLDRVQACEFLLERLCHVLALLLFAPLSIAAFLPLPHPLGLLADPRSLAGVVAVVALGAFAAALARRRKRRPPSRVVTDPSGLGLELDDPRHPLQKCPIVRDRDNTPGVCLDEPLEKLQAGEIQVVGRLVE
jgi:hypothetical protein